MTTDNHLKFLQEKVMELRSALFFSMSDAVLKLPTTIITAIKVDEIGQVWFFVNKPKQNIQEFDREFPYRAEFFKKGVEGQLKISGRATIMNDPEELNGLVDISDEIKRKAINDLVLVKVKIQQVEYFEPRRVNEYNWLQGIGNKLYHMFFEPQPQHGYAFYKQLSQ
ncbi:MAG: hypothetical protein H0V30_07710 [Chitinophagaceae bacterium]|jgi:hypothetical protein|nr:hypothetical protein [Chitinophagaceae bacterium]